MGKKAKTILVVDDDVENTRSYSEILTDLCYRVITRSDVNSALELLRNEKEVDLVITDYRMPGKTGLDFIMALRKIYPDIPVIMLTAYGDLDSYLRSMSLGAFEYVNKPISKPDFERIVRHALHDKAGQSKKGNGGNDKYSYH